MPAYNTLVPPPSLGTQAPLHQFLLFNAELVTIGEYSQQVGVPLGPTTGAKGIRVQIDHSANPGNCEYYIMEGSFDPAGAADYSQVPTAGDLTQAALTNGPNGATTRLNLDLIPFAGDFMCIFVKTPPSNAAIKVTARVARIA